MEPRAALASRERGERTPNGPADTACRDPVRDVQSLMNILATTAQLGLGAVFLLGGIVAASAAETTAGQVASSAAEARPLSVGSVIPPVSLLTADNQPFALREAVAKQPTVLIFYRGGWCPFCNRHLADLQTIVGDLKALNYQILAVTPDAPDKLTGVTDADHLTYTLLSDPHGDALKGFGVAYRLDDATVGKYKDTYHLDLEKWAGNNAHLLPVPSVFVLDTKGTIRFVYSNADYKVRLAADKVLAAARAAKAGEKP